MICNVKNGTLQFDGTCMEYIRFGSGPRILIMLPGLGDSLRSMKGTALPMALMYHTFTKDFTVYAFSRKTDLPEGYTTKDMAHDQAKAMDLLGIGQADIFGVSMGGMIAQHLAIDFPERVGKLVLAVTVGCPNPTMTQAVEEWISLAQSGNHTAFMESNLRKIYSENYYRKNKWMLPLIGKLTKPKSYDRFYTQAQACLTHDALNQLEQIQAPTFVIGGEKDNTVGGTASREIAAKIPNAKLKMYAQWGHGLYEEAMDFNPLVLEFLKK